MHFSRTSSRQGIALVLVLAFLALISVFIVGFFSSATGELSASSSYAAGVTTKQLADTAVNIVEGSIRAATTRPAPVVGDPLKDFDSWSSQPGVIRTFPGGQKPDPNTITALYKLYSAKDMIVEGTATTAGYDWSQDIPSGAGGWLNQTALYTDLNEPVLVTDPSKADGSLVPRYPVLDPTLFIQLQQGVTAVPLAANLPSGKMEGAVLSGDSSLPATQQYTRMPVRWLYVLKDGSVSSPNGSKSGGRIATFDNAGVNPPTVDNPIVGRVAFWTDDDTCKVNINTAAGFALPSTVSTTASPSSLNSVESYAGSYWDTPRLNTQFDRGTINVNTERFTVAGLGGSQPAANEFQRFPGHPATTGLAMLLKSVLSFNSNEMYNLSPRLVIGGSIAGSVLAKPDLTKALKPKLDRLYASVDELLYATDPTSAVALAAGQRVRDPSTGAATTGNILTPAILDQLRFFLTAHSRAPELNLFGRPRITLWPVFPIFAPSKAPGSTNSAVNYPHQEWPDLVNGSGGAPALTSAQTITTKNYDQTKFRQISTTEDKLIAFCSTIGVSLDDPFAKPYIFQRYDPYSQTHDWQIPRNEALLTILQNLTSTPIPGFGGAFSDSTKWGTADRDEVLLEMFDYIRCVNLKDMTHDDPPKFNIPAEQPPTYPTSRNTFKYAPHAVVVPSVISANAPLGSFNPSAGLGRFPLISEITIDFYHAGYLGLTMQNQKAGGTATPQFAYFYDRNMARRAPGLVIDPVAQKDPTNQYPYKGYDPGKGPLDPLTGLVIPQAVVGRMIGAFMVLEIFNPMQGYALMDNFDPGNEAGAKGNRKEYFVHEITGLDQFKIKTPSMSNFQSLQMPGDAQNAYFVSSKSTWAGRGTGGTEGFMHPLLYGYGTNHGANAFPIKIFAGMTGPLPSGFNVWYPFQSTPGLLGGSGFPVDPAILAGIPGQGIPPIQVPTAFNPIPPHVPTQLNPPNGILVRNYVQPVQGTPHPETDNGDTTFLFQGGDITVSVIWGPQNPSNGGGSPINTYKANFPNSSSPWPIPTDNIWYGGKTGSETGYDSGGFRQTALQGVEYPPTTPQKGENGWEKAMEPDANGKIQGDFQFYFSKRVLWSDQPSYTPWNATTGRDFFANTTGDGLWYGRRWRQIIQPGDTISRGLVPKNPLNNRLDGDPRVMALLGPTGSSAEAYFIPHPYYNYPDSTSGVKLPSGYPTYNTGKVQRHATNLRAADGTFYIFDKSVATSPTATKDSFALEDDSIGNPTYGKGQFFTTDFGAMVNGATYNLNTATGLPPGITYAQRADGPAADFDSGTGPFPDGAYSNKSDEGTFPWVYWDTNTTRYYYATPYYTTNQYEDSYGSFFSPNRQVQSAIMFGSLLSGRTKHWTTLAFSPNPAGINHPGIAKTPKDHLILDLFTMPVVEPYPISEPFSTAGKINLNYPIEPFSHIIRTSALRAALQPLRVIALEPTLASIYKSTASSPTIENPRYLVDRDGTIALMDKFFYGTKGTRIGSTTQSTQDQIFRSATQICEQFLVPYQPTKALPTNNPTSLTSGIMTTWWAQMSLTGDNMREKPYADLYPRITTKSNSYTVYMRVQVLRKRPVVGAGAAALAAAQQWNDDQDQVISEYRGSSSIERYLDPADPVLIDRGANGNQYKNQTKIDPDSQSLESAYKFRVSESKRFQP